MVGTSYCKHDAGVTETWWSCETPGKIYTSWNSQPSCSGLLFHHLFCCLLLSATLFKLVSKQRGRLSLKDIGAKRRAASDAEKEECAALCKTGKRPADVAAASQFNVNDSHDASRRHAELLWPYSADEDYLIGEKALSPLVHSVKEWSNDLC